jgi:hypothetical protein
MGLMAAAKKIVAQAADLIAALLLGRDRTRVKRAKRQRPGRGRARTPPSIHDLMPLDSAANVIFRRVYVERMQLGTLGRLTAHLDGLAYTIAELTPIYVYEPNGASVRQLTATELAGALFQGGAKEISYIDGRETITHLAVDARDVEGVIQTLIASDKAEDGTKDAA